MKRAPTADILWLFIATRLLLIILTYIGYILFPVPPHVYPTAPVDVIGLLSSWNNWDAFNYLRIAQFGYQNINDTAFFPLFPLLINGVSFLFGHQGFAPIGIVLSNLALLGYPIRAVPDCLRHTGRASRAAHPALPVHFPNGVLFLRRLQRIALPVTDCQHIPGDATAALVAGGPAGILRSAHAFGRAAAGHPLPVRTLDFEAQLARSGARQV